MVFSFPFCLMCITYVWCLHNTLSDQSGMSSTGGLQEKKLWGVVAEQQGKGQQSSSTQKLYESNLSLKIQGMACLACLKELLTLSDMAQRYLPTCALQCIQNVGLGCQVLRIKALSMMIPEPAFVKLICSIARFVQFSMWCCILLDSR